MLYTYDISICEWNISWNKYKQIGHVGKYWITSNNEYLPRFSNVFKHIQCKRAQIGTNKCLFKLFAWFWIISNTRLGFQSKSVLFKLALNNKMLESDFGNTKYFEVLTIQLTWFPKFSYNPRFCESNLDAVRTNLLEGAIPSLILIKLKLLLELVSVCLSESL